MKDSIRHKLVLLVDRYEEVGALLSDPEVISDQNRFRDLSREYSEIEAVVKCFERYQTRTQDVEEAQEMLQDSDTSMREMAREELDSAESEVEELELELQKLLLPKDPEDRANVFLEIRAGTGGDEAAIFSGNLFRMYSKYAESQKWQVEVLSEREGDHGGYKEIISRISGTDVYANLKFESGAHRVQRVPETETGGRVHTSAATVAVLPEAEEVDVEINDIDLKIDTYRASGAGGQHVNKTESAIRITHIPTGLVVTCQDESSQHKNRASALKVLRSRLLADQKQKVDAERAAERKSLVSTGDRSAKIRTYNFPQGRITDHRINFTSYRLSEAMNGELEEIIEKLKVAEQQDILSSEIS